MWQILRKKAEMPTADRALPGRDKPAFAVPATHFVNGNRIQPPFPAGLEQAMFGLGCFWGAERKFWEAPGVYSTAVGYAARPHAQPDLRGGLLGLHRPQRGRDGVVRPEEDLATRRCSRCSGRSHDPTQGMRQGNDVGTQYRSGIYTFSPEQKKAAEASRAVFQKELGGTACATRSPPRSSTRRRSTTPRTITSSTSPRTRTAIAASAAPA